MTNINDIELGGQGFDLPWDYSKVGKIVAASDAITTNQTIAAGGYINVVLSTLLPKDSYDYLCTIDGQINTTKTNNKTFHLNIATGTYDNYTFRRESWSRYTRSTAYVENDWGTCEIPIGEDRRITIFNSGSDSITTTLYLRKAKRIGKNGAYNTSVTKPLDRISIPSDTLKPNLFLYGNPTITDGIMTGCNYLNFGVFYNINYVDNYEWVLKVKTPSTFTSTEQSFAVLEGIFTLDFKSTSDSNSTSGYLQPYETHTQTIAGQYDVSNNTWYWIKITGSGDTKTYSISTDGTNYGDIFINTNYPSDTALNHHLYLGSHNERWHQRSFNGSIDLNECYCKYNGNIVWKGMDYYERKTLHSDNSYGEWKTPSNTTLFTDASISANGTKTVDLRNIIPNDGFDYECEFRHTVWSPSTAGQYINLICYPQSANQNNGCYISGVRSITAASRLTSGNFTIQIANSDRQIIIRNAGSGTATNFNLYLTKYRRVGKNSKSANHIERIAEKSDELKPNAIIYGSPTFTDSIVSNFTANNYLQIPVNKSAIKEIGIRFRITSSSTISYARPIIHSEKFFTLEIPKDSLTLMSYSFSEASANTLTTLSANTWYDMRIVINGTTKYFYLNNSLLTSFTDSAVDPTKDFDIRIGTNSQDRDNCYFTNGEIDLNGCYVKNANDEIIWQGMDYYKYNVISGDITDGQWVFSYISPFSNYSVNNASANVDKTHTLTGYLPDDVGMYDILFHCVGTTGSTSGNSIYQNIDDRYFKNLQYGTYVNTRASNTQQSHKSGYLTVYNQKGNIQITSSIRGANSSNAMYIQGYRKVYTGYPSEY